MHCTAMQCLIFCHSIILSCVLIFYIGYMSLQSNAVQYSAARSDMWNRRSKQYFKQANNYTIPFSYWDGKVMTRLVPSHHLV